MTRQDEGDREQVLIEGLDADGETVWEHSAVTEYRTELTLIEEIGLWQDRYCFNNHGVVTCLSLESGDTMWENAEFGGASISSLIDERSSRPFGSMSRISSSGVASLIMLPMPDA